MIAVINPLNGHENTSVTHNMNAFCGCGGNNQEKGRDQEEAKYQCPLNCEGNKTYNQPGKCPICCLPLVMVGLDESRTWIEKLKEDNINNNKSKGILC